MKKIRTFIAVKLSDIVIEQLTELQDELKSVTKEKVKWVNPQNMHVTLKFIGEISEEKLELVFKATETACYEASPFELSLEGLGVFPNFRRPRVVWVGFDKGKNSLKELAIAIDDELHKFGFPKEDREFSGHLTLARPKVRPKNLIDAIERKDFISSSTLIDEVYVIKSVLKPTGPIYTTLKSIGL